MLGGLRPLRQFRHTTGGVVPGYFARKVHDEIGTTAGQVCVCVKTQSVILFSGKKAVCHLEKG